ncbi:alkaline phosphatase family protein [Pseudonocardia sp. Cha107L01]|uniref:alkaline phosphatase family protein n=1 Tax=Pseudonocardia sp. Cha107L01 TaxID=3457576 RepID=UPI00403E6F1C
MSRGELALDADLVAGVLGNPRGAPPLYSCNVQLGQRHRGHRPLGDCAAVLRASNATSSRCWRRRLGSWLASAATNPTSSSRSSSATVFRLTWDDWGGFDDHVVTPNVEHTPDGVQLAYGPRVPLLMFGGRVKVGIDSRWSSHVSIGKTVLDLLGLPPLGVPRLDEAPSLADLINPGPSMPTPPAFGTTITQPTPPNPTPAPNPAPPPPTNTSASVGPVFLRDGSTLPPPNDQPVT